MITIPAFYFPTTLICVDDDPIVLEGYKVLFSDLFECKFLTDSQDALQLFTSYKPRICIDGFLSIVNDYEVEQPQFQSVAELHLSHIRRIMNDKDRNHEISLLLADYYMPRVNGLELCENIMTQPCMKMLLTGTNDYLTVLRARNKGIIDYFANKSDSIEQIKEAIHELSIRYFCNLTRKIIYHLTAGGTAPIMDVEFIKYFQNIWADNLFSEFFLYDKNCSFILADKHKRRCALIVHNDSSLDEFISVVSEYNMTGLLIEQVRSREVIPFFGFDKMLGDIDIHDIKKYLYPATVIHGKNNYYVSLVEIPHHSN
jgi:CheY-like chemotaxis protein